MDTDIHGGRKDHISNIGMILNQTVLMNCLIWLEGIHTSYGYVLLRFQDPGFQDFFCGYTTSTHV